VTCSSEVADVAAIYEALSIDHRAGVWRLAMALITPNNTVPVVVIGVHFGDENAQVHLDLVERPGLNVPVAPAHSTNVGPPSWYSLYAE
jgi:hypothetical protein